MEHGSEIQTAQNHCSSNISQTNLNMIWSTIQIEIDLRLERNLARVNTMEDRDFNLDFKGGFVG